MTRQEVATAERSLPDQANLLPRRQLMLALATLSITLLITCVDQNGISVALPTIAKDLHAEATISWAGTASLLANTAFQMLYGRLSDIFGRKNVFLTAIALLALADLLCGLAQSPVMFYMFRAVAGVGGGGIANLAMIIISDFVTLEQRGKYQGIIGAMVGFGNVLGPFLCAALIHRSSWRAFFFMLSPLAALTGCMTFFFLPSKPRNTGFKESVKKVDWIGSLVSTAAVVCLLIPLSGGGAYFAWDSPLVITMLALGFVAFLSFIAWEWKLALLPMMPVDIFKNPVVVVMLLQNFLFGCVYQSYLYYVPLYLQNAHQFSIMTSAILYMPLVISQSLISILGGQYISRRKRYGEVIVIGFGLWTLGAGLAVKFNRATSPGVIVIILSLVGAGVGCIFQPILIALQAHSPKYRRAVIISNRNFFRSAGGACGLVMSAAVLQARLRDNLPEPYKYLAESTYALPSSSVRRIPKVLDAYMAASHAVFILQVPLIGLCFLGTALIRDRGLQPPEEREAEHELAVRRSA